MTGPEKNYIHDEIKSRLIQEMLSVILMFIILRVALHRC